MIAIQIHTFVLCKPSVLFSNLYWLQFVYVWKRTFSNNILLLEFSFSPISAFSFYRQGKRRCADGAEKFNEIKADQSNAQTSWAGTAWEEADGVQLSPACSLLSPKSFGGFDWPAFNLMACTRLIDRLQHNRPVRRRRFVMDLLDLAGNWGGGG